MIAAGLLAGLVALLAATAWLGVETSRLRGLRTQRLGGVVAALPRCETCGELARWYAVPARGSTLGPRCDAHVLSRRNLMEEFAHAPALRELRAADLPATSCRAAAEQLPSILGTVIEAPPRSSRRRVAQALPPEPGARSTPAVDSTSTPRLPLLYGPSFDGTLVSETETLRGARGGRR